MILRAIRSDAMDSTTRWAVAFCVLVFIGMGCQDEAPAPTPTADQIDSEELFSGIATFQPSDTSESLEQKRVQVEENLQEAEKAVAEKELDSAIESLKNALYLDYKNRTAKLRMVAALHSRSLELESTDPHQSGMDIRLAGVYLTHLRNENEDFSEDEMRLFADVYFDEARVYGRTQHRQKEFAVAFRSAMDAGFADVERLKTEPDLEQFRTHPDTAPLIDSAIASLEGEPLEPSDVEPATDSNP